MNETLGTSLFTTLDNRYRITGEIVPQGPLAVSTGEPDEYSDSPVVKNRARQPFIPGSSFRGALRALIERILNSLGMPVCLLGAGDNGWDCGELVKNNDYKQMIETGQDEQAVLQWVLEHLCSSCLLFGSTTLKSRLSVSDLPCLTTDHNIRLRHRVGIDRDSDTASTGAKFDGEVVEKGSRFHMELVVENACRRDLGVLALGVLEMQSGNFWLGGDRAVGAGRCSLENLSIEYFGHNGYTLTHYLASGGQYQSMAADRVRDFLLEQVKHLCGTREG